jgi:tetratricopeptide (TPR) repeat protein
MFSNKARTFLELAENVLDARIAAAKGDHEQAIKYWEKAVEIQDGLYYGEPPEWFYPVRDSLGAALLLNGQAERAEAVFRADLEQYPRNPRSLFGLLRALESQKKSVSVAEVRENLRLLGKMQTCHLKSGTCKVCLRSPSDGQPRICNGFRLAGGRLLENTRRARTWTHCPRRVHARAAHKKEDD